MQKSLTKEIHYGNGVKLVYNERLRIWESRREQRTKQQFDTAPRNPQQDQVIQRIPATLTLKPLQNQCLLSNNDDITIDNASGSDSDIEVVFESAKPAQNSKPEPKLQPQLFQNVSANLTLKQIANSVPSVNRFADDEIEVEVIRNSNRVITTPPIAQRPISRPNQPVVKPLLSHPSVNLLELQQRLRFSNVTLTQQSTNENHVVPTQSLPVKPRISVKAPSLNPMTFISRAATQEITLKPPSFNPMTFISRAATQEITLKPPSLNSITFISRTPTQEITLKPPPQPQVFPKVPVETKKPTIKFEKCTESTLVCVVCKCVFLNPGDSELDSRLFGRFCCRKCDQFLKDCCSGKLQSDQFQCCNDGICDIGGNERCHYCWFYLAFIALNVDESQKLTSKYSEEKKRKYVYDSDSSYNGDKRSDIGTRCKFCGKYISSEYNMRVHWVHVHTEQIKDMQLPPSLERIRQQKYGNRRFKKAMSDDEY